MRIKEGLYMEYMKRKSISIYIVIIIIQLMVIFYWASAKGNFFVDELYSMGYASSYTGAEDTALYITTSAEWKLNEWVNNFEYKKYLAVSYEEQIFRLPFLEAIQKLFIGENYVGLLNIAESVAGNNIVTAEPGIILNLIFFVIAEIALIALMQKLKMNSGSQYLALAMFGFSGYVIGFAVYIRFYMLITMYLLLMLNLFYVLWCSNCLKRIIPVEIGIFLLTYLALKNSELTIAYFGALSFCFMIALLVSKKWIQLLAYGAIGLCGLIYIFVRTNYVDILLHPASYSMNSVAAVVSMQMSEISIGAILSHMIYVIWLFFNNYFGSWFLGKCIVILGAVVIPVVYFSGRRNGIINAGVYKEAVLTDRFKMKFYRWKLNRQSGFICTLLGATIIYILFCCMAKFYPSRYFCFGFITLTIVFWYVVDQLLKELKQLKMERIAYVILLLAVAISIASPFYTRNIEYVYEDDKDLKNRVRQYEDMDTILVCDVDEMTGEISRHETYDCVNQMSEDCRIYAFDIAEYSYDEIEFPPKFILWNAESRDISDVLCDLSKHGYKWEDLGKNHVSQVYVCKMDENLQY